MQLPQRHLDLGMSQQDLHMCLVHLVYTSRSGSPHARSRVGGSLKGKEPYLSTIWNMVLLAIGSQSNGKKCFNSLQFKTKTLWKQFDISNCVLL